MSHKSTPGAGKLPPLSRRERQILDVLYRRGEGTVATVRGELADPPSYSGVRALLRILEEKGHVVHDEDGPRFVFRPAVSRDRARESALHHMVRTFFDGSKAGAVAALLDLESDQLSEDDLERMRTMVEKARKEGR